MADARIYGPYKRVDGRKHIIIYENFKRITVSYPEYLMEQHLGRKLTEDETVDHIDNDFTNDSIDNLQILTRVNNIRKSSPKALMIELKCTNCSKLYSITLNRHKSNLRNKIKKDTNFCIKLCVSDFRYKNKVIK